MEYVAIVISSLALIAIIIAIVLIVKSSHKQVEAPQLDLKEIGMLQQQLNSLTDQLKTNIKLSVSEEINKVLEQSSKSNELNNEKLERFQKNITESLNTRFDALNKQIDDKLIEINKKVDEKLAEGFKTTGETMAQVRERLQAIDAAQKNIEELSKDVVSLRSVLEGNQSRGQYGEYQLSMVRAGVDERHRHRRHAAARRFRGGLPGRRGARPACHGHGDHRPRAAAGAAGRGPLFPGEAGPAGGCRRGGTPADGRPRDDAGRSSSV